MRSINNSTIQFGLVSVPVKIYSSASTKKVELKLVTPEGNFVKQKNFDAITNKEVMHADCTRGFEGADGKVYSLSKDELKALESEGRPLEIQNFIPASQVPSILVEKTYFLGPNKGGDKAYNLLSKVLAAKDRVAIAQWSVRGRDHLVSIRSFEGGLVLEQLFYSNETSDFEEVPRATVEAHDAELSMASMLVDSLSVPEFTHGMYCDGYTTRLQNLIAAKVAGSPIPLVVAEARTEQTLSLLEMLQESIRVATK